MIVFVGAGLANGLAAWRLAQLQPQLAFVVLEAAAGLGGRHTWSFHRSDISDHNHFEWLRPLLSGKWQGYDVRFPGLARPFQEEYASIRAESFARYLEPFLGNRLRLGCKVRAVFSDRVVLDDGSVVPARLVVDGRGFASAPAGPCGWQKFLGLVLRTSRPHGITRPVLMDACVEQRDGFRFFYALPWSDTEILIEDTRYSDTPEVDEGESEREILLYAQRHGLSVAAILEREVGALPIPFHGYEHAYPDDGIVRSGVAAGLFHPTTGYSLAEAVAFAERLAEVAGEPPMAVARRLRQAAIGRWREGAFFRRLNNMLFLAAAPADRWRVLRQFYGRDAALIARFYAGRLRALDRLRLLSGRPPVPMSRGLAAFVERRVYA
jgi:lycopene beta-cyclase